MRPENSEKRSGETTRRRILAAAITRFARASYEEVKLRDIAADVGVDVALVHRSFGSKEQLFAAAVVEACPAALLSAERSRLERIVREFRARIAAARRPAYLRSLADEPAGARSDSRLLLRDFIGPLAAKLDGPAAQQRAALFVSCLIGFSHLA